MTIGVPRERYLARVEQLRKIMDEEKLSGVVVANPSNILYLTGYVESVQPWERPVATIIPRHGEPLMLLNELATNQIKFAAQRGSCWVTDWRFYTEHPRLTNRLPSVVEWSSYLGQLLKEKGLRGVVGVDALSPRISSALQAARLDSVPVGEKIMGMRLIKDEYELAIMKAAGAVSDKAQEYYHSLIKPGKYIMEINQEVARFLAVELAKKYPDSQWRPMVIGWTGLDTTCPHGPGGFSGRQVAAGDNVINIINFPLNGYWVENERTYIVGEPSEAQVKAFQAAYEAQQAGFRQFREGVRVCDIDSAAQSVFEQAGLAQYVNHRTSHGKGIDSHEYPEITAYTYIPLKENMVLSCEPAIYIPGVGGFRHSDDAIVGQERGEWLTQYPRELAELTIRL